MLLRSVVLHKWSKQLTITRYRPQYITVIRSGFSSDRSAREVEPDLSSKHTASNPSPSAASKPQQITTEEAKNRAHQILQYFPGDTLVRKATYATLTGGLMAFLVANGIYIPNDETLILAAFVLVARALYVKMASPIAKLIDGNIETTRLKLSASREKEMKQTDEEIGQLEELRDFAQVTAELFQIKSENLVLEAQLKELCERNKFLTGIRQQLEEAVRKAAEKRVAEKKALVRAIKEGVLKELQDPRMQERILGKYIIDLQHVSLNGASTQKQQQQPSLLE